MEILVALAITTASLIATVVFGQQWWQQQQEAQFFADFQRNWAHIRQVAITDHVTVEVLWDREHQRFWFGQVKLNTKLYLKRPQSLKTSFPGSDNTWSLQYSGKNFTTPQTISFYHFNSSQKIHFSWQMGTGVLLRNQDDLD